MSFLWYAALNRSPDQFAQLLSSLATNGRLGEVNAIGNVQTGTNPLHIATFKNRIDIVKELISYDGVDLNAQTVDGRTALFIASEMNHFELVNVLLATGTRYVYAF